MKKLSIALILVLFGCQNMSEPEDFGKVIVLKPNETISIGSPFDKDFLLITLKYDKSSDMTIRQVFYSLPNKHISEFLMWSDDALFVFAGSNYEMRPLSYRGEACIAYIYKL